MNIKTEDINLVKIVNNNWNPSIFNVGEDILKIECEEYILQIYGYKTGGDESQKAEYIEMNFAKKTTMKKGTLILCQITLRN